jgi:pantetheine-phosphate adenylyltransferase
MTVDAAQEIGAQFIVRGVRLIQDFENEKHLAEVNRDLTGIETILLYTLPEYSHISSSIVRELFRYGQDVSRYLPECADMSQLPKD